MLTRFRFLLFASIILFVTGCSNKFKYFGNNYPPTTNAKIYFKEADIDQPYEIMGKMYASFKTSMKDTKVQNKIMTAVQSHGGDAAVFGDMSTRSTGQVSSSSGGSTRVGKKSSVGTGVTTSKDLEEDEMEILVIKFKPAQKTD